MGRHRQRSMPTALVSAMVGKGDDEYKKYYPYFTNRRHFFLPSGLGRIIGKPLLFSLSNGWAKYYQVDTQRRPVEMIDEF